MKIKFIGGLLPKERKKEIEESCIGGVPNSSNTLQWSILEGLNHYTRDIRILNLLLIGSYPKRNKKIRVSKFYFSHNGSSNDVNIPFINITGYKLLSRYFNLKKYIKRELNNTDNETTVYMVYSIYIGFIKAVTDFRRKNPRMKICLVVPDLPAYLVKGRTKDNKLYRLIRKIELRIFRICLQKIDCFVLLSKHMVEPLKIKGKPWVLVEGIYSENLSAFKSKTVRTRKKVVMYSGTLFKSNGIMHLLAAFSSIRDSDYELWICGFGEARNDIIEMAKRDDRVKFFGELPREEVLELQRRATVLINPRTSDGEFTKFSFPSKTMEYLASGTPTIIHKLPGIPDEYYKYCFIPRTERIDDLVTTIKSVCEKNDSTQLKLFGEKARKFILENKTPEKQCFKIVQMLETVIRSH